MNPRKTLAAGVAALGLAAAAPAQAALPLPSDTSFDVPQGKVEHTVLVQKVDGAKAIPSHVRTETWLGADRSHTIVTDAASGRLRAETVATRTQVRTYNAESNTVRVERRRRAGGLPINSMAFEAAVQKAYVEHGIVRVVGEKLVNGRRALITESVEGRWRTDEPASRTTAVVDAETYALYERSTVLEGAFSQTQTFSSELLDAASPSVKATMAMRKHPGAKVRRK